MWYYFIVNVENCINNWCCHVIFELPFWSNFTYLKQSLSFGGYRGAYIIVSMWQLRMTDHMTYWEPFYDVLSLWMWHVGKDEILTVTVVAVLSILIFEASEVVRVLTNIIEPCSTPNFVITLLTLTQRY